MTARRFMAPRTGSFGFVRTVGTVARYQLRQEAIAAGWNGVFPLHAKVTVTGTVYSDWTIFPAFEVIGSFPSGSQIEVIVNSGGQILGMGGAGGYPGGLSGGVDGFPGGPALRADVPIIVTNNGIIAGGGGGGGCAVSATTSDGNKGVGGSGGRGGLTPSVGGVTTVNGADGYSYGAGAQQSYFVADPPHTIYGGAGGDWGQPGQNSFGANLYAGNGGPAGAAVVGNGNITWLVTGTRYGAIT